MSINYNNSKVYKIWSPQGDKIYVGSTTKQYLSQRMTAHRKDYNYWKSGKGKFTSSYLIFDEYGLDDCFIELLEAKLCSSKDELRKLEGNYIRELECVNKCIAGRTSKEYTEDNRERRKPLLKQWREENKDTLKEKQKKYVEDNHDVLIAKKKEIMTCECCGKTYKRSHKSDHLKFKYHLNNKKE